MVKSSTKTRESIPIAKMFIHEGLHWLVGRLLGCKPEGVFKVRQGTHWVPFMIVWKGNVPRWKRILICAATIMLFWDKFARSEWQEEL